MTEVIKDYLKKNIPLLGAIGGIGGFISDVLSPLANLALFLLIGSIIGLIATWVFYFFIQRDKIITRREEALTRIVFFVFFIGVWSIFSVAQFVGPEQGYAASAIPSIENVQQTLGIVKEDVSQIKRNTEEIQSDTQQILAEIQGLKTELAAAQSGTISTSPSTAAEWYTNAILLASQGETKASVEAYEEFFMYGYPYLDAYQQFNTIAKSELSNREIRNIYAELSLEQPANIVVQLMNAATTDSTKNRREQYTALRERYGDNSVLLYWMMMEYSAGGTSIFQEEQTREWTTADQSVLRELIQSYEALPVTDQLETYFISPFAYDAARNTIRGLASQFDNEQANAMLDNPVVLTTSPTGDTNETTLQFIIYDSYKDIQYRIPGVQDQFTSTIAATTNSPWGSGTTPETSVTITAPFGTYDIELFWINRNDEQSATYLFKDVSFLSFEQWSALTETPVWFYPVK